MQSLRRERGLCTSLCETSYAGAALLVRWVIRRHVRRLAKRFACGTTHTQCGCMFRGRPRNAYDT
jgi:hypothetical protein